MKAKFYFIWVAIVLGSFSVRAQLIISDNYNVTGTGTGFSLNTGVNSGINPPTTRLTGTTSTNLRYILTATTKTNTAFGITSSKLRVTAAANPGRFTLSANGTTPLDFASLLGANTATPQRPVVYDIAISMANSSPANQRCSFALATTESDATAWDFGVQLYRIAATDTFYTIGKRIDTTSSGQAVDLNSYVTDTAVNTFGTEINFLIRVTDAGSETTTFNSRVQVSMDGGLNWFYDTDSDPDLPAGWRLNGAGRYILWDVAPDAGTVTYDNFSVKPVTISVSMISPQINFLNAGPSPNLKVAVSNAVPENLTVTFYGREVGKPYAGPDFLIPVLPDTQNYAREAAGSGDATKEMWFAQTDWIVSHRVSDNIPFVATLGDCVNNADQLFQWRNATNAMYRLEKPSTTFLPQGIPYGITVGNHDQDPNGDLDGSTAYYNQYFGIAHFTGKSYYGGNYDANNDSWYNLFSAGGLDFLVISFEYGRYGDFIMDWARDVMALYPTRRVIALTHFAGQDVADVNATTCPFSTQGQAIYEGLRTNANFFLIMSGHVFDQGGEGRRSDTFQGHTIRTLVSDYQGRFNGGNGLMRLMYFSPSNNLVSVKTYSPYTASYEIDANSHFSFSYSMQTNTPTVPAAFVALGTSTNVASGTQCSFFWSGRQTNKTYEWYVKVTDAAGNIVFSPSRTFTTVANSAPVAGNLTVNITGDQPTQLNLPTLDSNGDGLIFQTNSRPSRGLITSFDRTNGIITYLPARGFRGADGFTFYANDSVANSSTASVNLTVTAPTDTNSNGLPEAWEIKYGVTDPAADADGDGQNNLAEYSANTNPTNATSFLRVLDMTWQTNNSFRFTWSSVGGSRYRVQYANDLTNGFSELVRSLDLEMDASPYGSTSTQSFTDNFFGPTNSARFYRVKAVP